MILGSGKNRQIMKAKLEGEVTLFLFLSKVKKIFTKVKKSNIIKKEVRNYEKEFSSSY